MSLNGAILDRYSQEALISLAASEGLMASRKETDGVYERIAQTKPDAIVRKTLLEQIVLTPNITFSNCHDFLWSALSGPLVEEGLITNLSSDDKSDEIETLSLEVLAGMLIAAGHPMSIEEIQRRALSTQAALREQTEFTNRTGKEPPSEITRVIREMMRVPDDYTPDEYQAQRRRNEIFGKFRPVVEAVEEFQRTSFLASKHNLILRTPVISQNTDLALLNPDFRLPPESDQFVLFRVVASGLGKLTYRSTLQDSIKLSKAPATVALREYLAAWKTELENGEVDAALKIQSEIKRATDAMEKLQTDRVAGTITTWLSVPVSAVEFMFGLPPVLGVTVGLVGKGASAKCEVVSRKYRWAMFGNT